MNHDAIATALCGRYVQLTPDSGYLESNWWLPEDGTMIGAYVSDAGDGRVRVTDDGDLLFNVAVGGAHLTAARQRRYGELARSHGLALEDNGILSTVCGIDELPAVMARYVQAASAIAHAGLRHRPKDEERFERIIGELLEKQFGKRLQRRPQLVGISGHQLRFPFALDLDRPRETVIQTVAADDGKTNWKAAYEAGGKFHDIRPARPNLRLIAVLEQGDDTGKVARYFADAADVVIYKGDGELAFAA